MDDTNKMFVSDIFFFRSEMMRDGRNFMLPHIT